MFIADTRLLTTARQANILIHMNNCVFGFIFNELGTYTYNYDYVTVMIIIIIYF